MRALAHKLGEMRFVLIALGVSLLAGCPNKSKKPTARGTMGPPAMELRKAVSFPLASTELPSSRDHLTEALTEGLAKHVKLAPNTPTIIAEVDGYPSLRRLQVELTNAAIDTGNKPAKLQKGERPAPGVKAQEFAFRAEPLNVDGGHIFLDVRARDVSLGLIHDRAGQPILSLDEAREGEVFCQTTTSDLGTTFRASANERGKPFGLSVQKVRLNLTSTDERELTADVRMASHLLILPIQLHFTAHVSVDADGNATLSKLTCDGDDAAGTLITQFIRPSLKQYDNTTMPLVAFPSKNMRLHDVRVKVEGETVRLAAGFGS